MNKLLYILFFVFACYAVSAQVGNDPNLIGKDGSPVTAPSNADTRYNNRVRDSRTENESKPGLRQYNDETRIETEESPIYYENGRTTEPEGVGDTTRIYYFDAQGNPIRDLNKVYNQDRRSGPSAVERVDSVQNSVSPDTTE